MIIGLTGLKGSGKDTVAAYLVKNHGFERRAFADKLKESLAALFDIEFTDVDEMKWDRRLDGSTGGTTSGGAVKLYKEGELYRSFSWRQILQRYGTESHREIFGLDFWLDAILPMNGYYAERNIVITDVRFPNEAHRIKVLDGHLVLVDRNLSVEDRHASENGILDLPYSWMLPNRGTITELLRNAETMYELFRRAE